MKFIALNLKANNQYRDSFYRLKYKNKLKEFVSHCNMSSQILSQDKKVMAMTEGDP